MSEPKSDDNYVKEREKRLAEQQRAAADAYLFASRTPTQDDTNLSK